MQMTVSPVPECEYGGVVNEKEEVAAANAPRDPLLYREVGDLFARDDRTSIGHRRIFLAGPLQQNLKVPMGSDCQSHRWHGYRISGWEIKA